jgi:hypothetical protein
MFNKAFFEKITTISNYNFSYVVAYPNMPKTPAFNLHCSNTSSELSINFFVNTSCSSTNTRYFFLQLSNVNLSLYQSYILYVQPQRNSIKMMTLPNNN